MATINIMYRSVREKSFLHLRLLFRYEKKDYCIGVNTRLEVSKTYWNTNHNNKKAKDIRILNEQARINNEIINIKNYILNAYNSTSPQVITKEWLSTTMKHYYNPPSACDGIPTELVKYIGYYLEYRTHELNPPAVDKFKLLKKRLTGMQEFKQCSYLIKDVNNNFKNAMLSYYKFKKYAQNTIHRDLGLIKTLCKHARGMDVEVSPQMDDLELNRGDTYDIYLTFAELDKIELLNDNILTGDLASARDWLIISAYCAQRYSDFIRFTPEMIRPEGDNYIIEFTQLKTKENAGVMLHPKIINILNKRGWQFPKPIYIHKYNTYIKRICELAGITQVVKGGLMIDGRKEVGMYRKCDLVSSHIGRRSMITNYYGIMPTALLTTISGHKTINMLMTYLKKSNKDFAVEAFKYY